MLKLLGSVAILGGLIGTKRVNDISIKYLSLYSHRKSLTIYLSNTFHCTATKRVYDISIKYLSLYSHERVHDISIKYLSLYSHRKSSRYIYQKPCIVQPQKELTIYLSNTFHCTATKEFQYIYQIPFIVQPRKSSRYNY